LGFDIGMLYQLVVGPKSFCPLFWHIKKKVGATPPNNIKLLGSCPSTTDIIGNLGFDIIFRNFFFEI